MERELRILMLEDNPADAELIGYELRKSGLTFTSKRVETGEDFTRELTDFRPDLMLLDYELPSFDGSAALAIARTIAPDIPVIFVTGVLGEELAIDKLHEGATDYVLKSRLSRLVPAVTRALAEMEERAKRQAAEEALRESEEKYRTLYESSLDGIVMVDMARRIIDVNHAYLDMLGRTQQEVMGVDFEQFTPSKWHQMERNIIDSQTKVRGYSDEYEKEYIRKDGTVFPIELRNWLITDDKGYPTGMWAIVRDITVRKKAEEAQKDRERQLYSIFENVHEVLFYLSVEPEGRYRFLFVNQAFLEATELLEDQVVSKYVHEVIPEPSLKLVLEKYQRAIRDNQTVRWEEVTDYPAGRKYGEVAVTPIVDSSGRCTNLIGSVHDITMFKESRNK